MMETHEKIVLATQPLTVPKESLATFEHMFTLDLTTCDLIVCLASLGKDDDVPHYQMLEMRDDAHNAFRDIVKDMLAFYHKMYKEGRQPQLYDVTTKLDRGQTEWLDLSTYVAIQQQVEPLAGYTDFDTFQEAKEFLRGLRFYVIIVQPPHGKPPIYFYRHYSAKYQLTETQKFILFRFQEYEYTRITQPGFLFDKYIDCVSCGTDMFICKKDGFYRVFHYLEDLEQKADEILEVVRQRQLIENFEEFAEACRNDRSKMLILKSISTKDYLATLTLDALKSNITHYDLDIKIAASGCLLYESKQQWHVLHLLDDRYVRSEMTNIDYNANSKQRHARHGGG